MQTDPLMLLYCFDPMIDSRWDDLVETHPNSSVFHRKEWLKTLADTYAYQPLVLTSAAPGMKLSDGIAFCEVKSWVNGKSPGITPLLRSFRTITERSKQRRRCCRMACRGGAEEPLTLH